MTLLKFQCGLVLVDTPGIGENEYLETELINFISENQIRGFMYIIKTDNAGGVQEDRVSSERNHLRCKSLIHAYNLHHLHHLAKRFSHDIATFNLIAQTLSSD